MVIILLILNLSFASFAYQYLFRFRYLFSDRFGFIVAISGSTIVSLILTNNIFTLFAEFFTIISFINLLIGIAVGLCFGSLVNSQTLIAGVYSGGVGAVMGTMIGAVAKNPSICSLPSTFSSDQLVLFFGVFGLSLHILTLFIICYSLRV